MTLTRSCGTSRIGGRVTLAASHGRRPAIIDWAVYFRPAAWASAVAVIDAVTWHGMDPTLLDLGRDLNLGTDLGTDQWTQMLIRALIFRIGTAEGQARAGMPFHEAADDYRSVVEHVLGRV